MMPTTLLVLLDIISHPRPIMGTRLSGQDRMQFDILTKYNQPVPRYTSYPTALHFYDGINEAVYREWLSDLPSTDPLSLYFHIPFCHSLCWFCGCHTKIVQRYAPVDDYLKALICEIEHVTECLGARQKLRHLHFGGGTPTILNPDDVHKIGQTLHRHFSFEGAADFALEIDPRTVDEDKIAAWADIGLTRASLGVQDINPDVQEAVHRIQPFENTAQAVEWLRKHGIGGINFDLMYGLPHQTVAHVLATVDKLLTLKPGRLALFGYAHVPWMKRHQRLISEPALPSPKERLLQSEAARKRLIEAGYVQIGLDHFAQADDPLAQALKRGTLHRNFQGYTTDDTKALIGLGASSIGSLPQGYVQNTVPIRQYIEAVHAGHLPVTRGVPLSDEDFLRRASIERLMCDLQVDLEKTAHDFGKKITHFNREFLALKPLEADGIVEVSGHVVRVPPEGRPLLRTVCSVFDAYLQPGAGQHSRAI